MEIIYYEDFFLSIWSTCWNYSDMNVYKLTKLTKVTMMQYIGSSEILWHCSTDWDLKLYLLLIYLYSSVLIFSLVSDRTEVLF